MMYDIAVIGAGVTGCAAARELSRFAWRTIVLEKNLEAAEGTTKGNSAIIHAGYDCLPGTWKARLNVAGARMIRELALILDFPYRQTGALVLAFAPEEEAILQQLYGRGRLNGVEGLSFLSREEVLKLEPNLSPDVTLALRSAETGIVCPFGMTYAFLENAMENGVEFRPDCPVRAIRRINGGYALQSDGQEIQAKIIINAAGVEAAEVAAMAGETDYVIRPRRGEYRVLNRSEGKMVSHVIFQTPTQLGKGVLVTPTVYGNLMIGPSSIAASSAQSPPVTLKSLKAVDELARRSVPGLRLDQTIRTFAGLRATPEGGDFLIYPSEKNPGFIHAAGIESPGLASAPAIARRLLHLVLETGLLPDNRKKSWQEKRSGIRLSAAMTPDKRESAIQRDPAFGHIVCLCENVSEAEIRQAVRRPAGAVTTDGVKRRVRAGMGPCQGARCAGKVSAILAEELGIPEKDVPRDSKSRL